MILAGLAADGSTEVHNVSSLQRGYERLIDKLRGIGAEIELVGLDED